MLRTRSPRSLAALAAAAVLVSTAAGCAEETADPPAGSGPGATTTQAPETEQSLPEDAGPATTEAPAGEDSGATTTEAPAGEQAAGEEAVDYLLGQLEDGEQIDDNAGLTADVALAVVAVRGPDAAEVEPIADWLESATPEYVTENPVAAAKMLLVAEATGRDAQDFGGVDLVQEIEDGLTEDGACGAEPFAFGQALCVLALARSGEPVPDEAVENLVAYQQEDGSVGSEFEGEYTAEADTTGLALLALGSVDVPGAEPAAVAARDWLAGAQTDVGYWEGFSPVNSTAYAATALNAVGVDVTATDWMLEQQLEDGGLPATLDAPASDPLATAQGALLLADENLLSLGEGESDTLQLD